jgi:hypothetical protein
MSTTGGCDSMTCNFATDKVAVNKCGFIDYQASAFMYTCDGNMSNLWVYPGKDTADCSGTVFLAESLDCTDPDNECNCNGCMDCDSAEIVLSDCDDGSLEDDIWYVVNQCGLRYDNGTDGSERWDCYDESVIHRTVYDSNDCSGDFKHEQWIMTTDNCTEIFGFSGTIEIKNCPVRTTMNPDTTTETGSGSISHRVSFMLLFGLGFLVNKLM